MHVAGDGRRGGRVTGAIEIDEISTEGIGGTGDANGLNSLIFGRFRFGGGHVTFSSVRFGFGLE